MKKTVCYVDKEWGCVEDHKVVGDMGYTCCDMPDTLQENSDQLRENILNWINGFDCEEEGDTYDEEYKMFAIYLIYVVEVDVEGNEMPLWCDIDNDKAVLTDVCICAPERLADWVENEIRHYGDVKPEFHYRIDDED